MQYQSKKNIAGTGVVHGIEMYTPGDSSTHTLLLRTTSGTTGKPAAIIKKNDFGERTEKYHSEKPQAILRINPNRALGLQFALETFYNPKPSGGNTGLYIGKSELDSPYLCEIIKQFKPTFIHSTSGLFKYLLDTLESEISPTLDTLETVLLSGDLPSKSLMYTLQKHFPKVVFLRSYGMAEFGVIGLGCPSLSTKTDQEETACSKVHPAKGFLCEIIDQDESGIGEIVISRPGLEKYRTGDMGKVEVDMCTCGKEMTLTIYGRIDFDVIHCVGATILLSHIDVIFSKLESYIKDYLVEVREIHSTVDSTGHITVKIVPTAKLLAQKNIGREILNTLESNLQVTKTRSLRKLIENKIFLPSDLEIVDSLPDTPKKIRLRKVSD